jgi:Pregnancy-associated plasma protein-A
MVKAENRYGGNDKVNVWVVESIDSIDCTTGTLTFGYCSMARNLAHPNHAVDGCAITIDSLPDLSFRGGPSDCSTLNHELGHVFGLPHIFPGTSGGGCRGESDDIEDTFQFPKDAKMFDSEQLKCCSTGEGTNKICNFCAEKTKYNVTNYMSYSCKKGKNSLGDDPGTMPWATEQRADMFAAFYTMRRPPPPGGIDCNKYPAWFNTTPSIVARTFDSSKRSDLRKRDFWGPKLLRQGDRLLEELKKSSLRPTGPGFSAGYRRDQRRGVYLC